MNKHGKQFAKLFSAHFKMTFREKQVWFWSIFYPVLLMVIFMIIFGGGSSDSFSAKIALVEPQGNPLSQGLKQSFEQVDVFTIMDDQPVSQDQAESWLKDKEIDAVIVLPASVTDTEVGLLMNKESQNSTSAQAINGILNNMVLQANLMGQNAEDQLHVTADYISSGSEKLEYTDFILTGMIALAISQAGLFGMVGMVEMRRNGLLKRLMMTPVSMRLFGISNMSVRFILSAIQIVLLGLIGVVAFKANLDINLLSLLFIFIVGTLSFAGFGFMIAALSKSIDSYFGISNLISFLMMFLSGIFFDLSMLPSYIKPLSVVMPLTYFANGIRDSMVYDIGMSGEFWMNIGILAVWGIVTFLIGSKFYNWKAETR